MRLYLDYRNSEEASKMFQFLWHSFWNTCKGDKAVLTLEEDKLTRSGKQNKLFWVWMEVLGKFHGHHKNEMAEVFQQSILGETSFVSKLDGGNIKKHTRAKNLTVGEFQSFLEQIEVHAAEYGVRLPSEEEIDSDS
jgi:hypothetical protein